MQIPLYNRLRKQAHRDIAAAQDLVLTSVYSRFPKAVLHGGTAIWRCYGGNRFSEDLDFYIPSKSGIPEFFQDLKRQGLLIHKQRVKENSMYSLVEFNRAMVRVEALFLRKESILKEYELADGNITTVYTLTAEGLLLEKIDACLKRRKVRDLYDVFFLLRFARTRPRHLDKVASAEIGDEDILPALILTGPIPKVHEMRRYIAEWGK